MVNSFIRKIILLSPGGLVRIAIKSVRKTENKKYAYGSNKNN